MKKFLLACACVGSLAFSSVQYANAQTMVTQSFKDFMISDPYYGGDAVGATGYFQHVSSNGKYAVGYDDSQINFQLGGAFLWQASDPTELTPLGLTYNRISACDVSNDGIIVGSFEQREDEEKNAVAYPGWRTVDGDWQQLPVPAHYSQKQAKTEDFAEEARAITADGKYIAGNLSLKVGEKEILEGTLMEIIHDSPVLWEKQGDSYVLSAVYDQLGQAGKNKLYVDGELVEQADSAYFTQFFVRDISDDGKTIVGLNVAGSGGFNPAFIRDGELVQLFNCGDEEDYEGEDETTTVNFNGGTLLTIDAEGNMYGYYVDADANQMYFVYTADGKLEYTDDFYTCGANGKRFSSMEQGLNPAYCCSADGKVVAGGGVTSDGQVEFNYPAICYDESVTSVKTIDSIRKDVNVRFSGRNFVYITGEYSSADVYAADGTLVSRVGQGTPVNLSGRSAGTYVVKVQTADGVKTFKVAK